MKITALLTGRGNNTLKDKNLLDVNGKPVLYYPAMAGRRTKEITDWYCSSDDDHILRYAEELGYEPIKRPEELALPTSQHIDCILHALAYMRSKDAVPDILVVILANNVTIRSEWIDQCVVKLCGDSSISSVVPVYKDNDHHPFRAKRMGKDGFLELFEKTEQPISTNRQDLPACYYLAHNFWVLNAAYVLSGKEGQQPWGFMGDRIVPFEIEESIDIHTKRDLLIAEEWVKNEYTD